MKNLDLGSLVFQISVNPRRSMDIVEHCFLDEYRAQQAFALFCNPAENVEVWLVAPDGKRFYWNRRTNSH
jgi:hypothetical protein